MKILIILNGELKSPEFLKNLASDADYVICADGGYDKAKAAGIVPDLLLGDMDSVRSVDFNGEIQRYPAEKDWTDCELALQTATQMGATEITVTCALGGRCDHEMANLLVLSAFPIACIREIDVSVYVSKGKIELSGAGKTFSLIPTEDAIVTISGAKYPTEKALFKVGSSFGVSNEMSESITRIETHSGSCLLFVNEC